MSILTNGEIYTAYTDAANQTLRPQDERIATCDMTPRTMRQRPTKRADQGGQWRTYLMRFNAKLSGAEGVRS